jgi:hypothetical protein
VRVVSWEGLDSVPSPCGVRSSLTPAPYRRTAEQPRR